MRIDHDTVQNNMTTPGNFLVTEVTASFGKRPHKIKTLHPPAEE